MPRERFLNLETPTRNRLLRVATRHFAKDGFERASLNEILAEAGFSKGSYYYYFDDKEDLFATALEGALEEATTRLPMPSFEGVAAADFWPTVERHVKRWSAALDTSSDLVRVAIKLTDAQRKSPRFSPMLARAQAIYRMLIEPGQRLGCVRTDLPMDVLVRLLEANDAVLDAVFAATHAKVTRATLDAHVRLVFDTFKRLLATAPPASGRRKPTRRRRG